MFGFRECRWTTRRLWDLEDAELPAAQRKRVLVHLSHCLECQEAALDVRRTLHELSSYREQVTPNDRDDWQDIKSILMAVREAPEHRNTASLGLSLTVKGIARPLVLIGATVLLLLWAITISIQVRHSPRMIAIQPKSPPEPMRQVAGRGGGSGQQTPERRDAPLNVHDKRAVRDEGYLRQRSRQLVKSPATLVQDDLHYINAGTETAVLKWAPSFARIAPTQHLASRKTDDFVYILPPPIAGADPRATEIAASVYQREKAIVDPRLGTKVDLAVKGISFTDLCKQLADGTGIDLKAGRTVGDEKVTIFCKQQPLRDVMRQINLVFGFPWQRFGEEGKYGYELIQPLRAQLAEEQLRTRDYDAALIAIDEAMAAKAVALAEKPDKTKKGRTAAIQAYMKLIPAEIRALRAGKQVSFSTGDVPSSFPTGWASELLDSFQGLRGPDGPILVNSSTVSLSLDHSELGNVALSCFIARGGVGFVDTLASGLSPSASKPDNRAANKQLAGDPAFRREISLNPKTCQRSDFKTAFGIDFSKGRNIDDDIQDGSFAPYPHLSPADVWEEVHMKTGIPIVADYYTHLFPAKDFVMDKRSAFDAICQSGDMLGMNWKKDGDFLECRNSAFFWDKLKEVPNRLLDRWQKDREVNDELPIDDLLEMSALSDQQLDSVFVAQGIKHCRNIMEWNILSDPEYAGTRRKYDVIRPLARFLAALPRALRIRALSKEGLPIGALNQAQRDAFPGGMIANGIAQGKSVDEMRLTVDYIPAGRYVWSALYNSNEDFQKNPYPPLVSGRTPEETLKAAREVYPEAGPNDIKKSYSRLRGMLRASGSVLNQIGGRLPAVRIR